MLSSEAFLFCLFHLHNGNIMSEIFILFLYKTCKHLKVKVKILKKKEKTKKHICTGPN